MTCVARRGALWLALVSALPGLACERRPATPAFTEPLILGGEPVAAATLNEGHKLYGRYCASCHGESGDGKGAAGLALASPPRDFRTCEFEHAQHAPGELPSHSGVLEVISAGVVDKGMPAWRGLNAHDLNALGRYVETFCARWRASEAVVPNG